MSNKNQKPQKEETPVNQEETPVNKEKEKQEKEPVDLGLYEKYTALKSVENSGTRLKDETKKELQQMEEKLLSCKGDVPIKTVHAAIKSEQFFLFEGIPVPEIISKFIKEEGSRKFYFGK